MESLAHEYYMKCALNFAKRAGAIQEVPIGAVIVYENKIIATGYNQRNTVKNTLAHAELIAINEASKFIGDWRLENCTLYVTIEPCIMCAGAIVQARIKRVVFGAWNKKAGGAGSVVDLFSQSKLNHQVEVVSGVMQKECSALMSDFFKRLR